MASLLEQTRRRGTIRVAAQWEMTAEQYLDPDTQEPAGVVGKVGALLARDLAVEPEFVDLTWDDHIPALLDGRVDICLKHTNTPGRAFVVDFARGRLQRYVGRIVVRSERPWRFERELDSPERLLAVIPGSHQEAQARARFVQAGVRFSATEHEGMEAVARAEADACLADAWVESFLLLHPECEVLADDVGEPIVTSLDYAHPCIRKGDPTFLNWLDNWMDYHAVQGSFERAIDDAYREHERKFEKILAPFLTGRYEQTST